MADFDKENQGKPEGFADIRRLKKIKVKSFGSQFKIFHIAQELADLDQQVTEFIADNSLSKVISVSDATTTNTEGATMGIIRVLTYEA